MNWRKISLQLTVLGIVLVLWQVVPTIYHAFYLKTFTQVLYAYGELFNPHNIYITGGFFLALETTLYEVGIAFAIAVAVGLPVGMVIGYYKFAGKSFEPLIYLAFAIPGAALYPVFALTFGIGVTSKIVNGAFLGVFPMIINVTAGVRQTRGHYVRMARAFGAKGMRILFSVIIPGASGTIMSATRLALSFTFIGVIFGEVVSAYYGLGVMVSVLSSELQVAQDYAAILVIVIIVFAFIEVVQLIEWRLTRFERQQ